MSGQKSGKFGVKSPQRWGCPERAVAFIRDRHPAKTAEHVGAETGVPADTVRKWLDGAARPGFDAYSALIAAYGLPFLAAVMIRAPRWLTEAAHAERVAHAEAALVAARAALESAKGGAS